MTRGELQDQLAQLAVQDEGFRQSLIADPKTAIESAFKTKLLEDIDVKVVVDSKDECFIVVPHEVAEEDELIDELDTVTGGLLTLSAHSGHRP